MFVDLTARTSAGSVDLVPFLQRDAGKPGVELREWERVPAALAFHAQGWHVERIAAATGLHADAVRAAIAGTKPRRATGKPGPRPLGATCKRGIHEFTPDNTYIDGRGNRECRQCRRDRDQARARGQRGNDE